MPKSFLIIRWLGVALGAMLGACALTHGAGESAAQGDPPPESALPELACEPEPFADVLEVTVRALGDAADCEGQFDATLMRAEVEDFGSPTLSVVVDRCPNADADCRCLLELRTSTSNSQNLQEFKGGLVVGGEVHVVVAREAGAPEDVAVGLSTRSGSFWTAGRTFAHATERDLAPGLVIERTPLCFTDCDNYYAVRVWHSEHSLVLKPLGSNSVILSGGVLHGTLFEAIAQSLCDDRASRPGSWLVWYEAS